MRAISPKHIEAYQKGCLKNLFDVIANDPELSFEIRKDNEVIVYYRKGKILTIKYTDKNEFQIKPLDKGYYKDVIQIDLFEPQNLAYTLKNTSYLRNYFKQAKNLFTIIRWGWNLVSSKILHWETETSIIVFLLLIWNGSFPNLK